MNLLSAALPEFLGSLASGLVLGVAGWLVRRCGSRVQPNPERNDLQQISLDAGLLGMEKALERLHGFSPEQQSRRPRRTDAL